MELKQNECVGKCDWKPAEANGQKVEREGQPIFECGGCGSEWAPNQDWTPKNADGVIAPAVARARMQANEGTSENDSADVEAAPAAAMTSDIPPVIEAQADGADAPANDSADTVAAPERDTASGGKASDW